MIAVGQIDEDKYDRMKRIEWIDMERIHRTRCLVVGAGALGNEVVKDLVLSGFMDITVLDMDDIVVSNLSRCLFFKESDVRKVMKADIVSKRASELEPKAKITSLVMKVQDLEEWDYDIVIGCLDNIAARMHVNAHAYYHKIPYVDGATDGTNGKVQVVDNGPCLQCAMNRTHVRMTERRYTCTGNGSVFIPKMPSDISTTAVIAGMQVREAIKIASARKDLCIRDVAYYNGISGETEVLTIPVDSECPNHMR